MIPTLAAFMRTYPEIMLDLDFSDRIIDVIEEGFDAVVRFLESHVRDLLAVAPTPLRDLDSPRPLRFAEFQRKPV
jgi:DNA-binding transcriptional LysR family regulator